MRGANAERAKAAAFALPVAGVRGSHFSLLPGDLHLLAALHSTALQKAVEDANRGDQGSLLEVLDLDSLAFCWRRVVLFVLVELTGAR